VELAKKVRALLEKAKEKNGKQRGRRTTFFLEVGNSLKIHSRVIPTLN
jgi:hypothetical protein